MILILILTIIQVVSRFGVFSKTCAVLFRCLSRTMSEIRSAAASSIHAARGSHSAHGNATKTPSRRHGNRSTSANQNSSPPISPGNCRSAGGPRTRTLSNFFLSLFFIHRATFFEFTSVTGFPGLLKFYKIIFSGVLKRNK